MPAPLEILLVAYHFPPLAGMASNRATRLVNELVERGHRVTVVTGSGDPPLEGPCVDVDAAVHVVRAGQRQLSGAVRAVRRRLPAGAGGTAGDDTHAARQHELRGWVRDWVYLPDAQIAWFPAAYRAARRELERLNEPVLWTTSVPYTCHLVGAALKRRAGVRWVAEFRDPWVHAQDAGLRSPRRLAIDRRLERTIIRGPDHLVFTTPETAELFAADHGQEVLERTTIVPNAWQRAAAIAPNPPPRDAPLRLAYAGSLNVVQDAAPLVAAIERVGGDEHTVELHVAGADSGWPRSGAVTHHGPLPPDEVPRFLSRASAVVLLAPGRGYRPLLLGKTMDWLGSGQPCLAIVDRESATARIVDESHGGVVSPRNDVDSIAEAVHTLLDAHRSGTLPLLRPDHAVADRYEQTTTTDHLISAFSETAASR